MNQSETASRHTISLYVNNKPGVLNRIALVFSRRGWNIESLAVSSAHDERFSRCTITAFGDPDMLTRIIGQLGKLVDVVHAAEHTFDESFEAELALIKVRAVADDHMRVVETAAPWSARVVDRSAGTMVLQVAGDPLDVEQLHRTLSDTFEVIEIVRSGPSAWYAAKKKHDGGRPNAWPGHGPGPTRMSFRVTVPASVRSIHALRSIMRPGDEPGPTGMSFWGMVPDDTTAWPGHGPGPTGKSFPGHGARIRMLDPCTAFDHASA